MNVYLFVYDLMQFCGHSWIFTNMIIRFMSFGKDSLADTFYSIGLVMRLCQLLSVLEILHILVGIDKSRLFPRFLQSLCSRIINATIRDPRCEMERPEQETSDPVGALQPRWCFWGSADEITERIIVLFVVINSQEEVQGKYVVCVLFFLWNLLDVVRYTYNMLARTGIYYLPLTWLNFSLCILLYPLSVLAKGMYFIIQNIFSERKAHLGSGNIKKKRS
ncbi:very-long-chain (3R)-3-hydroxyacyl-CoA dehydratase 4 isoform X4 [Struthio camelus]|uniref:very-long-chain (3R)-3-hydroxyacyl-CoA dehydratase 4 isoform X4 n=1 Tax=Struthio camelus TaxID=8801 RepID=UPI00051E2517|nr:PREDICTED: very-long-chain (3R)-3-hydroxyacyl-CoA dehydratase 4 isoform X3 [Struthio camelus australis]